MGAIGANEALLAPDRRRRSRTPRLQLVELVSKLCENRLALSLDSPKTARAKRST